MFSRRELQEANFVAFFPFAIGLFANVTNFSLSHVCTLEQTLGFCDAWELEVNTVYYLETLVRSYVARNRNAIKKTWQLKSRILIVLDYLLSKGSETAYLLREDIL